MDNYLIILCGLPYSGKTTLRKKLIDNYGYSCVCVDEIMDANDMWKEGHPTQIDWKRAFEEAYGNTKKMLNEGKTVIFDSGNLVFKERENLRQLAKDLGFTSKLVLMDTPIETIWERRRQNQLNRTRGHVKEERFQTALKMWERPGEKENPIIFTNDSDIGILKA